MPPDFDPELKDFLKWWKADQMRKAKEGDPLHAAVNRAINEINLLRMAFDSYKTLIEERFKGLDARVASLEKDSESTGSYNVEQLKDQLKDAKAWKQYTVTAVVGAMLSVGTGIIIWFLTHGSK